MVLACLYLFRSAAIAVYVLCGLFTDNYVLSVSTKGLLICVMLTDMAVSDRHRGRLAVFGLLERPGMFLSQQTDTETDNPRDIAERRGKNIGWIAILE